MANLIIPPRDLPPAAEVFPTDALVVDNGASVGKATPQQIVDAGRPWASIEQAQAGTDSGVSMTPLTTRAAVDARIGTAVSNATQQLRAFPSYAAALAGVGSLPAEILVVSADVAGRETRWVRDVAGTALGGGWAPADVVMPQHYGGANPASLAAAVAANPNGSVRINYDETNLPENFAGVLLEYARRARFRTIGGTAISNNAAQGLFRAQMPSRVGGPRSIGVGVEMEAIGSGVNGPSNADIAFEIHADKRDYLSASAERGEIDGAYIFVRQGNQDDAGGLLIDARKTRLGTGDTGGMVGIECLSGINDGAGVVTQFVQTIMGFQEGAGGFTGAKGCGFAAEARIGQTHSGFAAISRTDIAGTSLQWAYYAGLTRTPADRTFGVNGATGAVHIGPPATEVVIAHSTTNLEMRRADGTWVARANSGGLFEARAGLRVSSDSQSIAKVFTATAALDYPSIAAHSNQVLTTTVTGALVGDLVMVSPTNNYASGNLLFTARVTANDTVSVQCQNISAAAIDPASQTMKIMVVRF